MKHMKKILAMFMALMLVMSLATTAYAGTITNSTNRAYKAYQIFSGTQAEGSEVLGDIVWGTGINDTAFLTALKADTAFVVEEVNIFAACEDAADVAVVLAKYEDKSAVAQAFANLAEKHITGNGTDVAASTSTTLDAGYYLLIDQTSVDGTENAKNPALLQVTNGTLTITTKHDTPEVDKTIKDEGEAADGSIGDTFTFVLTATMPSTFEGYDTYKVVFHDTLSKGLTYNNDAVVSVDGFTVTATTDEATGVTTITATCNDVLAKNVAAGSNITVTYTATLNENAVIGSAGNPNEVYLEYSNDPDWEGDGDTDDEPNGKTPEDEVLIFTYELDVTKVDGDNAENKLKDAEFVLLRNNDTEVATVVNGMVTGWVAVPAANTDGSITWPANTTLTSDVNGEFKIQGLDAGTYDLREIKAPAGYNLLTNDISIVITADITETEDEQNLNSLTISVDGEEAVPGDVTTGVVDTTVENNSGATLPETGGMGTTLFYILGGIMVLAAVVLLVTKKRMASAE